MKTISPPGKRAGSKPNTMDNDDVVTIDEARQRLGTDAPTRDAFHKANKRGTLAKLPQQEDDNTFRFRWGDIVAWRMGGALKKYDCSKQERANGYLAVIEATSNPPESSPRPTEAEQSLSISITDVLLGAAANINQHTATSESAPSEPLPALEQVDLDYLAEREAIVHSGIKASITAAKALHEIKSYRNGLLWKKQFRTFEQYLHVKWDYKKSQGYHLAEVGGFVAELVCNDSANAEKLPVSEGQLRPLFAAVPKEHRIECWTEIVADKNPADLTGSMVAAEAKKFVNKNGLASEVSKPKQDPAADRKKDAPKSHALMSALSGLQKTLRLFTASTEKLTDEEHVQLKLVRGELDRFFEQALSADHGGEEVPS
jgi:hypothetical protein